MADAIQVQNDNEKGPLSVIKIENERFRDILRKVVPKVRKGLKTRKTFPIVIKYDDAECLLTVADAIYNSASVSFEHECVWREAVELDGVWLKELLDSYKAEDILELVCFPDRLEIVKGRSRFKMPRL